MPDQPDTQLATVSDRVARILLEPQHDRLVQHTIGQPQLAAALVLVVAAAKHALYHQHRRRMELTPSALDGAFRIFVADREHYHVEARRAELGTHAGRHLVITLVGARALEQQHAAVILRRRARADEQPGDASRADSAETPPRPHGFVAREDSSSILRAVAA